MRLIDADALKENVFFHEVDNVSYVEEEDIDKAPTVDAVSVVMCKDCKHVGTDATCCLVCTREGMGLKPYHVYRNDFCSYGERRSE